MPLSSNPNAPHGALPPLNMPTGTAAQGIGPASAAPSDPLATLKGIHLPAPVEWWPLAPGWWLLMALSVIGLIAALLYLHRYIKRNAYRRQAQVQLQQLANNRERDSLWLQALNELLKRCAHSAYPLGNTSALHGKKWGDFLQQQADKIPLTPEALALLSDGGYKSDVQIAEALSTHANKLLDFTQQWITKHPRTIKQPAVDTAC